MATTIELMRYKCIDGSYSNSVYLIFNGYQRMSFRNEANIIDHANWCVDTYRENYLRLKEYNGKSYNDIQYALQQLILIKTALKLYTTKKLFISLQVI